MTAQRDAPHPIQPIPDALVEGPRESFALTFVHGLQALPPCQRAALVLHDVLGFGRAEVAQMMETTEGAVDQALDLGRSAFDPGPPHAPLPEAEADILRGFHAAYERGDAAAMSALLAEGIVLTLPPRPTVREGRPAVTAYLIGRPGPLVPTRANGQPAFACYARIAPSRVAYARGMLVLRLEADRIAAVTCFGDTSFFGFFGLPRMLRD